MFKPISRVNPIIRDGISALDRSDINGFILYAKTKAFIKMIYPSFVRFPKYERHSMALLLKEEVIKLLSNILRARSLKSKRIELCQESDASIYLIFGMLDVCNVAGYYTDGYYVKLTAILTEVKKLLVGYIKANSRSRSR